MNRRSLFLHVASLLAIPFLSGSAEPDGPKSRRRFHRFDRPNDQLVRFGESNGNSKLTREQVEELRRLRRDGGNLTKLGKQFGITKSHAAQVARGLSWR